MDGKVYVPNYNSNMCVYITNNQQMRVYPKKPSNGDTLTLKIYYPNGHYMYYENTQSFNSTTASQTRELCLPDSQLTNNVFYRLDIHDILVTFLIISIFGFYIPYKILSRAFGRWLKW